MSNAHTTAFHRTLARRARKSNAGQIGRKYIVAEVLTPDLVVGTRVTVIREHADEGLLLLAREDGEAVCLIKPACLSKMAIEESDEQREAWLRSAYPHLWC